MTKQRQQSRRWPKYDVAMIRDFLKHLEWELRTYFYEHTNYPLQKFDPNLSAMLRKYQQRRHCKGLLYQNVADARGIDDDAEKQRLIALHLKRAAAEDQRRLDGLESLKSLFDEAFVCASHPNVSLIKMSKLTDLRDEGK